MGEVDQWHFFRTHTVSKCPWARHLTPFASVSLWHASLKDPRPMVKNTSVEQFISNFCITWRVHFKYWIESWASARTLLALYHMRNGFDRESNPRPQRWQALMLISNIELTTAPLWQPWQGECADGGVYLGDKPVMDQHHIQGIDAPSHLMLHYVRLSVLCHSCCPLQTC
jgi:hypothetical protein